MIQPVFYSDMPTKLIFWDLSPDINKGGDPVTLEPDTVILISPVQLFKNIPQPFVEDILDPFFKVIFIFPSKSSILIPASFVIVEKEVSVLGEPEALM